MLFRSIVTIFISTALCYGETTVVTYDYYEGLPATDEQLAFYRSVNELENCTINIQLPCNADEWRRVDGSCNNINHPSRGTYFNPMSHMLPPVYHNVNEPRKAESGNDLKSPRAIRLELLKTGKSVHPDFTLFVAGFIAYAFLDVGSVHDIENFVLYYPNCCAPENVDSDICAPNFLEADDPVHRFDGIRCLNMTRPEVFQDHHCTNEAVPSAIMKATHPYDLSQVYNEFNQGDKVLRTFDGGLIKVDIVDGKIFPLNGPNDVCILNEGDENTCFKYQLNGLLPAQMFMIWFIRNHNYIATKLAAVNPCWDDETLFQTARDLNIAFYQQIFTYEWLSCLIDPKDLVTSGVHAEDQGFREVYDESLFPQVSLEYSYLLRWFHVLQETNIKQYDTHGNYLTSQPIVNLTFRPGFIGKDNNLDRFTQGFFRQSSSDFDGSIDNDMTEQGLGGAQRAVDIPTSDLHKGRLFGLAPYIDYVNYCSGIQINTFEDLVYYKLISEKKVALLKEVYEHPRDIELMAALWLENTAEGGRMPITLACIFKYNSIRSMKADRHWYESATRPHAFTKSQLSEVRKVSLSSLLCSVGDGVTEVQPNAFLKISSTNPLTPCSEIPQMDFNAWADSSCH